MNALELKQLTQGGASHIARSLYAFYLRPRAERGIAAVTLNEVSCYLQCDSPCFPTSSDLRIAELALDELEQQGFIRRVKKDAPWDGAEIELPLFTAELRSVPQLPFQMTSSWRPGPSFPEACRACGLADPAFEEQELSAFTVYWASRPEKRSQIAWERAFAQRLARQRSARVARKGRQGAEKPSSASAAKPYTAAKPEPFKAQ
jgi:DNA replication protein DnaT